MGTVMQGGVTAARRIPRGQRARKEVRPEKLLLLVLLLVLARVVGLHAAVGAKGRGGEGLLTAAAVATSAAGEIDKSLVGTQL